MACAITVTNTSQITRGAADCSWTLQGFVNIVNLKESEQRTLVVGLKWSHLHIYHRTLFMNWMCITLLIVMVIHCDGKGNLKLYKGYKESIHFEEKLTKCAILCCLKQQMLDYIPTILSRVVKDRRSCTSCSSHSWKKHYQGIKK